MTTTHVQQPSLFAFHKQVIPTGTERRAQVLAVVAAAVPDITNREIANALALETCSITGRVNELRAFGLIGCRNTKCPNRAHLNAHADIVHDACKRRCRVTGASVFAWRVIS